MRSGEMFTAPLERMTHAPREDRHAISFIAAAAGVARSHVRRSRHRSVAAPGATPGGEPVAAADALYSPGGATRGGAGLGGAAAAVVDGGPAGSRGGAEAYAGAAAATR